MVGNVGNILDAAQRARLLSMQKTARQLDVTSARLATGQKVLSALDNPGSYFIARSLRSRAGDLTRLLDGIGQSIKVIEEADHGVKAELALLDQAESYVQDLIQKYYAGELPSGGLAPNETLVTYSSAGDWVPYVAGQDMPASGTISINGPEEVTFDGNYWRRKAFNYTVTAQTVLEFDYRSTLIPEVSTIGFDNDTNYMNDNERFWLYGTQTSGITYAAATSTYEYSGSGAWEHIEIPVGNFFTGSYSHLNIVNDDDIAPLGNTSFRRIILREGPKQLAVDFSAYEKAYADILQQIDEIAVDAQYRGINLLKKDDMTTFFNTDYTSKLVSEGIDGTSAGLGLTKGFRSIMQLEAKLDQIRAARNTLRGFGGTLATNLNVIQIRDEFTRGQIDVSNEGAAKLTDADLNEEGATLLALQTQQQLQAAIMAMRPANILTVLA